MPRPKAPPKAPPPQLPDWWQDLVRDAIAAHGGNVRELTRKIGCSSPTVMAWLGDTKGRASEPSLRYLLPLISQVDSAAWRARIFGTEPSAKTQPLEIIGQVAAGVFSEAGTEHRFIEISSSLWDGSAAHQKTIGSCYGLEILGESMEPVYAQGDVIIVRRPRPGADLAGQDAVVIDAEHQASFKRVSRLRDGGLVALPINTHYDPFLIQAKQIQWVAVGHIRIPGRVPKMILPPSVVRGVKNLPAKK